MHGKLYGTRVWLGPPSSPSSLRKSGEKKCVLCEGSCLLRRFCQPTFPCNKLCPPCQQLFFYYNFHIIIYGPETALLVGCLDICSPPLNYLLKGISVWSAIKKCKFLINLFCRPMITIVGRSNGTRIFPASRPQFFWVQEKNRLQFSAVFSKYFVVPLTAIAPATHFKGQLRPSQEMRNFDPPRLSDSNWSVKWWLRPWYLF